MSCHDINRNRSESVDGHVKETNRSPRLDAMSRVKLSFFFA